MIRVDAVTDFTLLNRYLAKFTYQKYEDNKANLPTGGPKTYYKVQWNNIRYDLRQLLTFQPLAIPRVAYSLAAFWYILAGMHDRAVQTAFLMGSIAFDAATNGNQNGESSATVTFSHTATGSDLVACIGGVAFGGTLSATYDGNSATEASFATTRARSWYYIAPDTGASNVVVTSTQNTIIGGGVITLTGADQSAPLGASTFEDNSSSPNDMTLTTEEDGSMRVDVLRAEKDNATNPTGTLDSGDLRVNSNSLQNQFSIRCFMYTNEQATAGSDTHAWTTDAFNRQYMAFEIKAAAGATTAVKDIIGGMGIIPFAR